MHPTSLPGGLPGPAPAASLARHAEAIELVRRRVLSLWDEKAGGVEHGPVHWQRVGIHAQAIAQSLDVDPLVPYLFAWVHDSRRQTRHYDPEHGQRAAQFVLDERDSLFAFLTPKEVQLLAYACRDHTSGLIQAHPVVQACWDADRLDLWRVSIEPHPEYMCTPYARQFEVIDKARALLREDRARDEPS